MKRGMKQARNACGCACFAFCRNALITHPNQSNTYVYIILVLVIIILYLCLIHPYGKRKSKAETFCKNSFAHRGLHDTVPENTISAFRLAKDAGVGIELDVRLTKDDEVVVFHDETLLRAAGRAEKISDLTFSELQKIPLFGSEETIPLLSDVLKETGRAPLLVEIKAYFECAKLCEKTADILKEHNGNVAVESFSPIVLMWFSKNRPEFLRGQLSSRFKDEEMRQIPLWERILISNLLTNFLSKPDFIAYDVRNKNQISFVICRKIFQVPHLLWTTKCGKKEGCIFEN